MSTIQLKQPNADTPVQQNSVISDLFSNKGTENEKFTFTVHNRQITYIYSSCGCFGPESCLRKACVWLLTWWFWEPIVIFFLLTNTVLLACYNYTDRYNDTSRNSGLQIGFNIMTGFFGFEIIIKIIALGLWGHPTSFFRSPWYIFDLIVEIFGITNSFPEASSYRGMRIFDCLRVLRISYNWSNMKKLIVPLLRGLQNLGGVIVFLAFILYFFALIGLHLFQGSFYCRCRSSPFPTNGVWPIDASNTRMCSAYGWGIYDCPSGTTCGHPDMFDLSVDTQNEDLRNHGEVYYGAFNYDNLLRSLLTSFQVISFDNWADVMYRLQDSTNKFTSPIYFPLLVFIGAFFSLNLIVAVIVDNFQQSRNQPAEADDQISSQISPISLEQSPTMIPQVSSPMVSPSSSGEIKEEKNSIIKQFFVTVYDHLAFKIFIALIIVGNAVVLMINRYSISQSEIELLDILDTVFWGLFVLEMFIGMIAKGLSEYLKNKGNLFDIVVNLLGLAAVILVYGYGDDYTCRVIAVMFRAIRIFKIVNKWEPFEEKMNFIWNTRIDILNFLIFLIIFMVTLAIIGMELFANEIKIDSFGEKNMETGSSPRNNFDTFGNALRSIFICLVGDNWTVNFWTFDRFNSPASILFYFSSVIILAILMVNLFLAIILENFFQDELAQKLEEEEKKNDEYLKARKVRRQSIKSARKKNADMRKMIEQYQEKESTLVSALKVFRRLVSLNKEIRQRTKEKKVHPIQGESLNIFSGENQFRILLHNIFTSPFYQIGVFVIIFVDSILVTFTTSLYDPESDTDTAIKIVDIILTVFFVLECIAKIIAFGFINNGLESYLKNGWNILDLLLTIIRIISFFVPDSKAGFKRLLMVCRVLRAIRIVRLTKAFRLRISAIFNGFPKIVQMLLFGLLFLIVFGIIGVELYKGRLQICDEGNASGNTIVSSYDCMNYGGEWKIPDIGFDHIGVSMMTLFELMTGKDIYYLFDMLPDAKGQELNPVREINPNNVIFVIVFTIIGRFIITSIITGVISDTYFKMKDKLEKYNILTNIQLRWAKLAKIIFKAEPLKAYPNTSPMYPLYRIINHNTYILIQKGLLYVLGILLAISWFRSPDSLNTALGIVVLVIFVIYAIDAILNILCHGMDYIKNGWHIYEFIVIFAAIVLIILNYIVTMDKGPSQAVLFLFCTAILACLFKHSSILKKIFQTFILSIPGIMNLTLLLLIALFLLDVAGVVMLAEIKLQSALTKSSNFQNLWVGFLTMFRLATLDAWNDMMHDAMREKTQYFNCIMYPSYQDYVNNDKETIGCGSYNALVFFILVILIIVFLFLNLFIAIVIGSMMEISKLWESVLSDDKLEKFQRTWQKYDPEATGFIEIFELRSFLSDLGKPLGPSQSKMRFQFYSAITMWMLELKLYKKKDQNHYYVEFYDVIENLVKKTLFKPETLDNIYNNETKTRLMEGLRNLYDEKSQIVIDKNPQLLNVEALAQYYEEKWAQQEHSDYEVTKMKMPLIIGLTLRITQQLKRNLRDHHLRAQNKEAKKENSVCMKPSEKAEIQPKPEQKINVARVKLPPVNLPSSSRANALNHGVISVRKEEKKKEEDNDTPPELSSVKPLSSSRANALSHGVISPRKEEDDDTPPELSSVEPLSSSRANALNHGVISARKEEKKKEEDNDTPPELSPVEPLSSSRANALSHGVISPRKEEKKKEEDDDTPPELSPVEPLSSSRANSFSHGVISPRKEEKKKEEDDDTPPESAMGTVSPSNPQDENNL